MPELHFFACGKAAMVGSGRQASRKRINDEEEIWHTG